MSNPPNEVKIQVRAENDVLTGRYANHVMLHMNREEFCLDFINMIPPHATLNARVMVTPTTAKRLVEILKNAVERYEKEFGALPTPSQPLNPPTEYVQ